MKRTITVTLTDEQYRALGAAVALASAEDEGEADIGNYRRGQARARENGWRKINAAWRAP